MSQLWDVSPFFVGDGKEDIGPLLRHIKHLDELDRKKDDENVLKQGSHFSQRIYLSNIKERRLVTSLITESMTLEEFLSSEITSENGTMIHVPSLFVSRGYFI